MKNKNNNKNSYKHNYCVCAFSGIIQLNIIYNPYFSLIEDLKPKGFSYVSNKMIWLCEPNNLTCGLGVIIYDQYGRNRAAKTFSDY